jgi:hypothetical protein
MPLAGLIFKVEMTVAMDIVSAFKAFHSLGPVVSHLGQTTYISLARVLISRSVQKKQCTYLHSHLSTDGTPWPRRRLTAPSLRLVGWWALLQARWCFESPSVWCSMFLWRAAEGRLNIVTWVQSATTRKHARRFRRVSCIWWVHSWLLLATSDSLSVFLCSCFMARLWRA